MPTGLSPPHPVSHLCFIPVRVCQGPRQARVAAPPRSTRRHRGGSPRGRRQAHAGGGGRCMREGQRRRRRDGPLHAVHFCCCHLCCLSRRVRGWRCVARYGCMLGGGLLLQSDPGSGRLERRGTYELLLPGAAWVQAPGTKMDRIWRPWNLVGGWGDKGRSNCQWVAFQGVEDDAGGPSKTTRMTAREKPRAMALCTHPRVVFVARWRNGPEPPPPLFFFVVKGPSPSQPKTSTARCGPRSERVEEAWIGNDRLLLILEDWGGSGAKQGGQTKATVGSP